MQQATDFLDETHALGELIAPLSDADYLQETAFKSWTIDMVPVSYTHLTLPTKRIV